MGNRTNLLVVYKLLNPCSCKDIWTCKCRSADTPNSATKLTQGGLEVLANAASLRIHDETTSAPTAGNEPPTITVQPSRSCCQSSNNQNTSSKRKDPGSPFPTPPPSTKHRGPFLPPIQTPSATASISTPLPTPEFPTIPPLSSIAALAGSGCTCGFRCTCPGCVEHRGPQHANQEHGDCTDGNCGTCVNHDGGVELPTVQSHHSSHASSCCGSSKSPSLASKPVSTSGISFVDSFFARRPSVSLPPAPPQRARRGTLTFDPTDTTVYPSILFTGGPKHFEERGPAFGLVNVPKLRCCAGKCGCPDGSCGCDYSCGGCCNESEATAPQVDSAMDSTVTDTSETPPSFGSASVGCCSSRVQ